MVRLAGCTPVTLQTNRRGWHATVAFVLCRIDFWWSAKRSPVPPEQASQAPVSELFVPLLVVLSSGEATLQQQHRGFRLTAPASGTRRARPLPERCAALEAAAFVGVGSSRCGALNLLASRQHPSRPPKFEELHG